MPICQYCRQAFKEEQAFDHAMTCLEVPAKLLMDLAWIYAAVERAAAVVNITPLDVYVMGNGFRVDPTEYPILSKVVVP